MRAPSNLNGVTLTAMPGPTERYDLSMLSADDFAEFGLYLPENVTGEVAIVASAVPKSGCVGFRGSNIVTIAQAGVTAPVVITMVADNTCTAGAGGTMGGRRQRRLGRRRRGHRRWHRGHRRRQRWQRWRRWQRWQRWQRWIDGHGRHGGIPVDHGLPDVPARRQQRLRRRAGQGRRDLAKRPAGRHRRRRHPGQDLELRRPQSGRHRRRVDVLLWRRPGVFTRRHAPGLHVPEHREDLHRERLDGGNDAAQRRRQR